MIEIDSEPATYTSLIEEEFFGAIGRLAISWAHLELGLDGMVEILYRGFEGNLIEPEMPRSLQRKIVFLRAAFRKLPLGAEPLQGYLNFLNRVQTAAQTRHDIIHGIVIEHAERTGEAVMVRIIRNRNGLTKKRIQVNTKSILAAAVEAQKLSGMILEGVTGIYAFIQQLAQNTDNAAT